jgi:hypothetical protein
VISIIISEGYYGVNRSPLTQGQAGLDALRARRSAVPWRRSRRRPHGTVDDENDDQTATDSVIRRCSIKEWGGAGGAVGNEMVGRADRMARASSIAFPPNRRGV